MNRTVRILSVLLLATAACTGSSDYEIMPTIQEKDTDSPVFTHLTAIGLKPMSDADLSRATAAVESASETLATVVDAGRSAARASIS